MPFNRPPLKDIVTRIKTDIESRLNTGILLKNSFLSILATAFGGAVHLLHGHIQWASQQLFVDSAENEFLQRWASIWGISSPPATFATGSITATGSNGSIIPENTRLKRNDDFYYVTTDSATISGGTATIPVIAIQAGLNGNITAGTSLNFVSSLSGINTDAVVSAGGITNGADVENIESLRQRLLDRIQQPPHGGASFDYIKWAKEVNKVTRAWVYPLWNGPGTVSLTFVLDNETDIIPDAGKVAEVQAYLDDPIRKVVTADITVFAPVPVPLNFTIDLTPDSSEIRQAVQDSLKEMLKREAQPGGTILISKIREAISLATGENDNVLTAPSANVTHATGEIATFGTITWI